MIIENQVSLKVSNFQKQIFLFLFEPKKRTKLFFDFCPKDIELIKSKNEGKISFIVWFKWEQENFLLKLTDL